MKTDPQRNRDSARRRSGGRTARKAMRAASEGRPKAVWAGLAGGAYKPLTDPELAKIHDAALTILADVGVADPTPVVVDLACAAGCTQDERGRLRFPRALVEDVIARAARSYTVFSRNPRFADIHVGGDSVNFATSGEAVSVLDLSSRSFRPSTIRDLYDFARVVDCLDNIHQFGQTVVPTDIEDLFEHDINVAYALMAGTEKPCEMAFNNAAHIEPAIELFDMVAGGEGRFAERPFVSFGGCPIVSPLRFAHDNLDVLVETSRRGMINDIAIAPQAGATAPARLAGTLAQVTAEGLACLCVVNIIRPGCPMSFANWPFAVDLRTGSFSGGSGEVAVASAAAAQIGRFYDLPTTVAASMSDSKLPDAQAGYEKGISAVVAGLAGANRVLESAGMLGSLMGCSFEALVIDNDMLGMAQRILRGVEVTDDTLDLDGIKAAALGVGHYLGAAETLAAMETEYLYPEIADRRSTQVWAAEEPTDMLERASAKADALRAEYFPDHIDPALDRRIRERFPIRIDPEMMSKREAHRRKEE